MADILIVEDDSQILESAKHLEEVTEKRLIMGNVREGDLRMERMDIGQMFFKLKEKYPKVETDCQVAFLNGDKTLVFCLLENLVRFRSSREEGTEVFLSIKNSMIEGKEARLLLLSNNQTLKISWGNKVICVIEDLWDDIKEEEWAQLGILKIEAESYIKKKKADAELKAIAEEFF